MGIIESIKRRPPGTDAVAHWGRILYIDPLGLGRARIRLEIHDLDLPPVQRWVATRIPKDTNARVGDDVYCKHVNGSFSRAEVPYRIHWDRPPQYSQPPDGLAERAQKVFIGHLPPGSWQIDQH